MFFSLMLACSTSPEDLTPPPQPAPEAAPEAAPQVETPVEGLTLMLDGTERWPMDEHTRGVMAESRSALSTAHVDTLDQAVALGVTLQGQLDRLISGCTMEGAAHDELHVFLMVWIPEVSMLQEDTDKDTALARVLRLQALLAEYDRFFE